MQRIVLKFGLLSGAVLAALSGVMVPLCITGRIPFDYGEVIGYTSMVLAFLLVFFGIRTYREEVGGGAITFGRAFGVGISIALITCAVYVVTWEIAYYNFFPDFMDTYAAASLDKLRARGATEVELAAKSREMAEFAKAYANPLFNVGITFLEVFPVSLVVTLVSAAILRRKSVPGPSGARAATA